MKKIVSQIALPDFLVKRITKQFNYCQIDSAELDGVQHQELLADAEGLIVSPFNFDKQIIDDTPNLKVLSTASVGYNHLPLDIMLQRNIIGTHTPYVLDDTVADAVMALVLASARRISELDKYVKAGKWQSSDNQNLFGQDVHHKKMGIIGMGRIGRVVAKRAKCGFDMSVCYYDIQRDSQLENQLEISCVSLNTLLTTCDFVVLMVPLTDKTSNFMNLDKFKLMQPTSIFINASRGKTVDETALLHAIDNRLIYAAGLDVFVEEPISPSHPFLSRDNILTVPHIGSAVAQTRLAMVEMAVENAISVLNGQKPKGLIKDFFDLYSR